MLFLLERIDQARDRVHHHLARPRRRRLPAAPVVLAAGEREERLQIRRVLRAERGAELVGRQEALLDQDLAVPLPLAGRLLAAGIDVERVHPVIGEQDVRKRLEPLE